MDSWGENAWWRRSQKKKGPRGEEAKNKSGTQDPFSVLLTDVVNFSF